MLVHSLTDGKVRGIFTTYYLVIIFVISLLGSFCCRSWAKLRLLNGQRVDLASTGGWIKGAASFAKAAYQIRTIPGGWLGWLMILIFVMNLVGTYAVSIFVKARYYQTTCPFDSGMIVNGVNYANTPSANSYAYRMASTAQNNNWNNALLGDFVGQNVYGIYKTVGGDISFLAGTEDYLGWWTCDPVGPGVAYTNNQTDFEIAADLLSKGYIYDQYLQYNVSWSTYYTETLFGSSTETFLLSASNITWGSTWNISAAVDVQDTAGGESKLMQPIFCYYECSDEARTVDKIVENIKVHETLYNWMGLIQGNLYWSPHENTSRPIDDVTGTLGWFLNSMVMVAGSGEYVGAKDAAETYGCMKLGTNVPDWVLGLAAVLLAMALVMSGIAIFLFVRVKKAAHSYDKANDGSKVTSKEILDNTPMGLYEWVSHAAYESRDVDKIPPVPELKKWTLSTSWHGGRRIGLVREHEQHLTRTSSAPLSETNTTYPDKPQFTETTSYYPDPSIAQNGPYTAVHTNEVR